MGVTEGGIWYLDDTEVFSPPGSGLDDWFERLARSISFPEGTITQPWRMHYKTTSQSVVNDTFTEFATGWVNSVGDPGSAISGITHSSDGYTVSQDGVYRIEFDYVALANATGFRQAQIRINGTVERSLSFQASHASSSSCASVAIERSLSAGDIVSMWVRQNSGAGLGQPTGSDASRKFIRRVALL